MLLLFLRIFFQHIFILFIIVAYFQTNLTESQEGIDLRPVFHLKMLVVQEIWWAAIIISYKNTIYFLYFLRLKTTKNKVWFKTFSNIGETGAV